MCVAGAVDEKGRKPFYAEDCASMLAVTFSSGGNKLRSIVGWPPRISVLIRVHVPGLEG